MGTKPGCSALSVRSNRSDAMKTILACAAMAAAIVTSTASADAKGCLKGAVVGGTVGHFAGRHGVLGAAAGCVVGRHRANQAERQNANPPPQRSTTGSR
jgi:hypothetical protein